MNAFLAALNVVLFALFIGVATDAPFRTFIQNHQTLIAGLLAIGAALIAFAGALRQAQATARAAELQITALQQQTEKNYNAAIQSIEASASNTDKQIEALQYQTERNYNAAVDSIKASANNTDRQIAALRQQTQDEFEFRHQEADRNRKSLIAALYAEIKAIELGIERRKYIELCKEKIEKLKVDRNTRLPEFGFSQNYMPVLDAAAGRIGELPPDIAQGVAKVGILAKSSLDQANLVHEIGMRDQPTDPADPSARPSPISGEYKIGLMKLLLADAEALTAAIEDILPKLKAHLEAMPD
ncbi:MAG: hypothetical protein RIB41_10020 [Oceanibaculum nanhaiense]|jgi:hypothetical protein|uniref:hypothetical protein n=1 Tax=Oceanibaculum nanhaiense TaxID=1909734 RepID=UPI0032EDD59F